MGFGGVCAQRDLMYVVRSLISGSEERLCRMFHVSQAECCLGMHADMLPQNAAERTGIRFDQRPSNNLGKAHAIPPLYLRGIVVK